MPQDSLWTKLLFIVTVMALIFLIYYIIRQSSITYIRKLANNSVAGIAIWIFLQFVLSISGIYSNYPKTVPPLLILFGVLPTIFFICYLFFTVKGKHFLQGHSLEELTNIHIIRIPVEFTLLLLYWDNMIPQQMSFLGTNFDILVGISAPLVAYLHFKAKLISRTSLLVWHIVGVLFLLHIVIIALLSAPTPLQAINFEHPNIAITKFPYVLLPTFIVPVVLLSHLVCIKRLLKTKREDEDNLITTSEFYKS